MPKINGITLDAVLSEEPQYEAEVTAYAVESGDTTDNVHNKPIAVTIVAVVSDATQGLESERSGSGTPSQAVREALESLRGTRQPFTYEGVDRVYKSVVFESLTFPRDATTGYALTINATLREINVKSLIRVAVRGKFRPARKAPPGKLWLCPSGTAIAATNAANLKNKCRVVTMKNGAFIFADNGKILTSSEVEQMRAQNLGRPVAQITGPIPARPSIAIPTANINDKAITFAPGDKAIKKLTTVSLDDFRGGGRE